MAEFTETVNTIMTDGKIPALLTKFATMNAKIDKYLSDMNETTNTFQGILPYLINDKCYYNRMDYDEKNLLLIANATKIPEPHVLCVVPSTFYAIPKCSIQDYDKAPNQEKRWFSRSYSQLVGFDKTIIAQNMFLFNSIFNNSAAGDFVYQSLNDEGKKTFDQIYELYKKYNFTKPIGTYKTIKLDITPPEQKMFNDEINRTMISIGGSRYFNITFVNYKNGAYTNKSLKISSLTQKLNMWNQEHMPETYDTDLKDFIQKNITELYLIHKNYDIILKTLETAEKEHAEKMNSIIDFQEKLAQIIAKYSVLAKIEKMR